MNYAYSVHIFSLISLHDRILIDYPSISLYLFIPWSIFVVVFFFSVFVVFSQLLRSLYSLSFSFHLALPHLIFAWQAKTVNRNRMCKYCCIYIYIILWYDFIWPLFNLINQIQNAFTVESVWSASWIFFCFIYRFRNEIIRWFWFCFFFFSTQCFFAQLNWN